MKLTHLGISHFRSIGETPVMIDLDKKITVLVGQNDCGKSNVLNAAHWMSQIYNIDKVGYPSEIDYHFRNSKQPALLHIRSCAEENSPTALHDLGEVDLTVPLETDYFEKGSAAQIESVHFDTLQEIFTALEIELVSRQRSNENIAKKAIIRELVIKAAKKLPRIHVVPQFRRIEDQEEYSIGGRGIVRLLAHWQHPEIGNDHNLVRFERVQKLLRDLLKRSNLTLEVPHTQKQILVRDGSLRLPLESHGTGIHQLIILAIAVLSEDNAIFGIEEPEIHLHPVLQRRFLKFLREETGNNRYIITTHSQTMIAPAEDVDVIHLKMVDGVTIPTRVTTNAHALEALDDLGVRASDLLQANAVIWVEGPSDRIYLKRWMELVSRELGGPELIEGIDYAMMFYGGRLLSHLSLEREGEIDDGFIQLLRINQRSAIVMDSDRKESLDEPLNGTKQRVIAECESNRLHAWVTDGREIENYLTQRTVEAAAKEASINLADRFLLTTATSKFDDAFKQMVGSKAPAWCNYAANKVPWAHRFVKHIGLEDMNADLKERVTTLIHFIRRPSA
ncbi:MAG: AAA family ATPase [Verrucomicrobiaceae bacterium]|nr:AAA family ATPase [Verrucomicrobiaceae bacterium]